MNLNPALRAETASDELSWSAFRFVAGEMTADESFAFETRLADDQAAREAVAEAVELFHAVCAAEASESVVAIASCQRSAWSQKLVWLTMGASAAAILVAVGLNLGSLIDGFSPTNEPAVATVTPALADAWSAVRSEFSAQEEDSADDGEEGSSHVALGTIELSGADGLSLATEAPSWMTAAVLGVSSRDLKPLDVGESSPQEN